MLNKSKKNRYYDDIGVFDCLEIIGKDFVLDQVIKEDKELLTEIQIGMETVLLNGDKDMARANILHGINFNLNINLYRYPRNFIIIIKNIIKFI
jgi:hypothetical protein